MPGTEGQKSHRLVMNTQRNKRNPPPRDTATGALIRSDAPRRGRIVVAGRNPIRGPGNVIPEKTRRS